MQNTFYRNNFDYILIREMDQEEMLFVAVSVFLLNLKYSTFLSSCW